MVTGLFAILLGFAQAKDLFLKIDASEIANCEEESGCAIMAINKSLGIGDRIILVDSMISGNTAVEFLDFLNHSTYKNISVIGSGAVISSPGLGPSDTATIHVENATFEMSNISFELFERPVLSAQKASVMLNSTTFASSTCTNSALMGFLEANVTGNMVKIANNTANTQSILVAMQSNITFSNLEVSTTFMESKDIRAAIHLVSSTMTVTNSSFLSNTMRLPLMASSNTSALVVKSSLFQYNQVLCAVAMEFNSTCDMSDCQFKNGEGAIIATGQNSTLSFTDGYVDNHKSDELLFGISDSHVAMVNTTIVNSSVAGVFLANTINDSVTWTSSLSRIYVKNVEMKLPVFSGVGGVLEIVDIRVKDITSSSEVIAVSHQNAERMSITSSKFTRLSSSTGVAAAVSAMNVTTSTLEYVKMNANMACGCLFENTTLTVGHGNFTLNQCYPQGNAVPLGIVTVSLTDGANITDTVFLNNTALSGSVFLMNATALVSNSSFLHNNAVQGAGLFGAGMNLDIEDSEFIGNNAMGSGGALSLAAGNATVRNTNFTGNTCQEGGAIAMKENERISIIGGRVRSNNSTNGTFINGEGARMELIVRDVDVDDDFTKAVWLDHPEKADFAGARFSCRTRCVEVGKLTPRPIKEQAVKSAKVEQTADDDLDDITDDPGEPSTQLSMLWIIFPVSFVIAAVIYRRIGMRGVARIFAAILDIGKGKHAQ